MSLYADTLRELTGCDPYEDHAFHHSISLTCDLCTITAETFLVDTDGYTALRMCWACFRQEVA